MKRVHTTKKSSNRPFNGAPSMWGYNMNNTKTKVDGMVVDTSSHGKIARPAYKRAQRLN